MRNASESRESEFIWYSRVSDRCSWLDGPTKHTSQRIISGLDRCIKLLLYRIFRVHIVNSSIVPISSLFYCLFFHFPIVPYHVAYEGPKISQWFFYSPLPHGQIGEVCIRGNNVTKGYLNSEESNQQAFAGGWFHTGDQGKMDDEGYLSLVGRIKELINR